MESLDYMKSLKTINCMVHIIRAIFQAVNYIILDIEGCAFKPENAGKPPLETYHIPKAHPNEFLIEKSPQYARGNQNAIQRIARNMLEANPKMKLFAFLTGCLCPLSPEY